MWYRILGLAAIVTLLLMIPTGVKAQPAFEDVAPQMGLNIDAEQCGNGFWYDYDGDGDLDLLRGAHYGSNTQLYRNDGNHFTQLGGIGLPVGADVGKVLPLDFDHDGDIDILASCYHTAHELLVNENGTFVDRWTDLGLPLMAGGREMDWIDFNRDGWMDILLQTSGGWHVFQNEGGVYFTDATLASHLPDDDGAGLALADVDLDGNLEMFATRLESTGRYWKKDANGAFVDRTAAAGLSGIPASFCCVWVDFNNDKYPDLLTQDYGKHGIWLNNGDGTFRAAIVHGTECDFTQWPHGAWYAVADYDMDGLQDFYCCRPGGCSGNFAPNQFFHMDAIAGDDIWFHDVAPELGMAFDADGFAGWSDYDGDGDLDLTIISQYEPHIRLFQNNTLNSANCLQVQVEGPNGEKDRWHARVEVYDHTSHTAVRTSEMNFSSVNCNGLRHYFTLDPAGHYDLKIYFPDGTVMSPDEYSQLSDVVPANINHMLTVRMGQTTEGTTTPTIVPATFSLSAAYPNPFNAVTSIRYSVPVAGLVRLSVYNIAGQHVTDLVNGSVGAGEHLQTWNASALSSGIYFAELRASNAVAMQKLVLLK